MILVREVFTFKPEFASAAQDLMQEMDDLVGPGAHAHPGWRGHAKFYQNVDQSAETILVYPWVSKESHRTLVDDEAEILAEFTDRYCARPRQIDYYSLLSVDVEET